MRIERFDVFTFSVPFRTVFRHASASRRRARNLIVAARGPDGATGWGESCPRPYVTSETVDGAAAFVVEHRDAMAAEIADVESLRAWMDAHRTAVDRSPAGFCAAEIAVLDLLGKVEGQATENLLDIARPTGDFRYSAVLGDSPWPVYRQQCRRYLAEGFLDFKVKVSGNLRRDRRKMRAFAAPELSSADRALRVRIDANNLWRSADECIQHIRSLGRPVFAVEEPLQANDLDGFGRVADGCGTRIVLDESLLRVDQLEAVAGDPGRWIANVRVSKMGGVIRALDVAARAAELGIGVIVGCQVGETSILTRAALAVMQSVKPDLLAAEGAFGTHLLQRDLTSPSIMFGPAGVLASAEAVNTGRGGFGLAVDERAAPGLDCWDGWR